MKVFFPPLPLPLPPIGLVFLRPLMHFSYLQKRSSVFLKSIIAFPDNGAKMLATLISYWIKQQSATLIVNPGKSCYFKGNCVLYVLNFKSNRSYSINKSHLKLANWSSTLHYNNYILLQMAIRKTLSSNKEMERINMQKKTMAML